MAAKRLETASRLISRFASLDVQILEPILAENYTDQFVPVSLPDQEPLDRKGLFDLITTLKVTMEGFPMTVKRSMESEAATRLQ
jgi:hypothetical protein